MGELINGRTPEEIKRGLYAHSQETLDCKECPYDGESRMDCSELMCLNALALIRHLEAQQPKWISVKDRLPEDCKDVLVWAVYHEEYGRSWALREVDAYCKGVGWENTADPDVREVAHWMPLPQQPEEDE